MYRSLIIIHIAEAAARISSQVNNYNNSSTALIKESEAPFNCKVEVNDLKNRYILTRSVTQTQIYEETGANVSTKGKYYADVSKATEVDPPLYLLVEAQNQSSFEKALNKIDQIKYQDFSSVIDHNSKPIERPQHQIKRRWDEFRLYVNIESFKQINLRAKIVGPQGIFVKYIQQETNTKIQIKGVGSGFIEPDLGKESSEPMYINVTGPDSSQLPYARDLLEDLLLAVKDEFERLRNLDKEQHQSTASNYDYSQYYDQSQYGAYDQSQQPPMPPDPNDIQGQESYRQYWASYGYNVDDPQFIEWQKQQQEQYAIYYQQQQQQEQYQQTPQINQEPNEQTEERRQGQGIYGAVPPPPNL